MVYRADDVPIHGFINEVNRLLAQGAYDFTVCPSRVNPLSPLHKQDVIAALLEAKGNYGVMAHLLGRSRASVKRYVETRPDVWSFYEDHFEAVLDKVEDNLIEAALEGDLTAARFVLQTRGKERGYTTRVERTGKDGGPMETVISPADRLNILLDRIAPREEPDLKVLEGGKK